MEYKELVNLITDVYNIVGKKNSKQFESILGGCNVIPSTEWFGDTYLVFKKILKDKVINDTQLEERIIAYIEHFSQWFS